MTLDEAIKAAMEYEGKVYKTYVEAMDAATDEVGKRVFKVLRDEEKGHLSYLKERLDEWQSTGKVTVAKLDSSIPTKAAITQSVDKLRERVGGKVAAKHDAEIEMLRRALKVEEETSNFYKEMVRTLDAEGQQLFERFVEIEEGHLAIVQAELDSVSGSGFWFDTAEFSLEL